VGGPLVTALGDYDGFVHTDIDAYPSGGRHTPSIGTTQGLAVAAQAPQKLARTGSKLYASSDGAASWQELTRPGTATGGQLAFSADGAVLLWSAGGTTYRTPDLGADWAAATGLGNDTAPSADPLHGQRFYAYSPNAGAFSVSVDAGVSFATKSTLANGGSARLGIVPGVSGDVWVALGGGGLTRSVDGGNAFQRIAGVDSCAAIGFGAAPPGKTFPAAYLWGAVSGGPRALYRSDDAGGSWVRINDDAHQYGGPGNGQFVIGDANVYGRVFMSSVGRGLIVGELVRSD
jgi:photosystem II stability/assembly factor-like uncharacterized protein